MKTAPLRLAAVFVIATFLFFSLSTTAMSKTSFIYIATQNPAGMGIALAEFDPATGALSAPKMAIATPDASHFTLSNDGEHLYMCNSGTPGGVSAFAVDRKSGALRLLNFRESKGRGPSFVSIDGSGRYVLNANYGGGYVEVYSLAQDGSLDQQTAFVEHAGSSVHPQRQTKAYAHWFRTDPTNKFALAADLGMDQVVVYKFDAKSGKLTPNDPPGAKVAGGMGPRHLAFHPNGKWVYGTAEIANEVMAFRWDAGKGVLTQFQSVKTLAEAFKDANTTAEIVVRADGKFLYASNRGEDSIVVYAINSSTGELTLAQRTPSRGRVPRYFTLDPSGKWLIVSNQEGGNLAVFGVDAHTGTLQPVGEPVALARPMGLEFLR